MQVNGAGPDHWFRGDDWDAEAQSLFRKKIARARDQKWFYRRVKALAIAGEHPEDAIALLQECIEGDPDEASVYHEAQAQVHLMHQQLPRMFAAFDRALGEDGMGMMAHGAMQYAFLVGLYRDETRYRRALKLLKAWDRKAMLALMRRFEKSFGGNAGEAMILYELGKTKQAIKPARRALDQALAEHGPIPGYPELGRVPNLPDSIRDRLIVIADLWDEKVLGPVPDTTASKGQGRPLS